MTELFLDFETRSFLDLTEVGVHNYAAHPSTKILMLGYAFGDDEPRLWEPHKDQTLPPEVKKALADPAVLKLAWNAAFERTVFNRVCGIWIPYEQWADPAVAVRYLSLPGWGLESAGEILGLPADEAKMKESTQLIRLFCKPFNPGGKETLFGTEPMQFHNWEDKPREWTLFGEYCLRDVSAERRLWRMAQALPLPDRERRAWVLDQRVNDRGVPANMAMVQSALAIARRSKEDLVGILKGKTGVENPNSRDQLLSWAKREGYPFGSLGKGFVNSALVGDKISPLCREVLEIRKHSSKTSYKKFEAIEKVVCPDGRMRDQFMFYGAPRAGRWSGHTIQLQNMPCPDKAVENKYDRAVALIEAGNYNSLAREFPSPITAVTSCLRSIIQAPAGRKLVVCDLNAIETRVLWWLARCEAGMRVFRDGRCPYLSFATKMYNVKYEELAAAYERGDVSAKEMRQVSKPAVLAAGYGLGGGEEKKNDDGDIFRTGLWGYAKGMGLDMSREDSHLSVKVYRDTYPEVPELWRRLEGAGLGVLREGGSVKVGPVEFDRRKRENGQLILRIKLPSGRHLHYLNARVERRAMARGEDEYEKDTITYDGIGHGVAAVDKRQQWGTCYTYGAKMTENIVQAISRDILLEGMFLADDAGASIVLHAHDEIACLETDGPFSFSLQDLRWCMMQPPAWAPDLPLGAEGYEGRYYRK